MTDNVYLSLGNTEEKTRNAVMASIGDCVRRQYEILNESGVNCVLEWNRGDHFKDVEKRMAKGMAWILQAGGSNDQKCDI